MRYAIFLFLLNATPFFSRPQSLSQLTTHKYGFALDHGFDAHTSDSLRVLLKPYRRVLQAEGGSHDPAIYRRLPLVWIHFLHENFGVRHFFFENGHGCAVLEREYLRTGDTSMLHLRYTTFWQNLRAAGLEASPGGGVDFERPRQSVAALQLLWKKPPPPSLAIAAALVADTNRSCDAWLKRIKALKKEFQTHQSDIRAYLGDNCQDYSDIVDNPGSCKDALNNRNPHMADD